MKRQESEYFERGEHFQRSMTGQRRKNSGVFFTPEKLARKMADQVFDQRSLTTSKEILAERVLDPAMGTGHFLLAALDRLSWDLCQAWKTEQDLAVIGDELWITARQEIAGTCLFGVDLDSETVDFARTLLIESCEGTNHSELPATILAHLGCAHSLLAPLDESFGMGAAQAREFTVILGNPPYLSYGLRDQGTMSASDRRRLLELFPQSAEYKISIYALFVELATKLLGPNGDACFVLPDSFLLGRYFSKIRGDCLKAGARLRSITLFEESFWQVNVGRPVILHWSRRDHEIMDWRFHQDLNSFLGAGKASYQHPLETRFFAKTRRNRFYMLLSGEEERFYRELFDKQRPLSELLILYSGLIAKSGGKKSIVVSNSPGEDRNYGRLMEKGSALKPFQASWDGAWILKDASLYRSGYRPEYYEGAKLLLNQTGCFPKAAADFSGLFVLNNVHIGVPMVQGERAKEGVLDFVAGILNSQVARVIYEFLTMEGRRALAQIDLDVMRSFPIPPGLCPEIQQWARRFRLDDDLALNRSHMETLNAAVLKAYGFEPSLYNELARRVLTPFEKA
jgi:adenine-specific DNA-methyltransferase